MLAIKIPLKEANKALGFLKKKGLFDNNYGVKRDKDFLFIPVVKRFKTKHAFVNKKLKKFEKKQSLREVLSKKLTKKEFKILKTAYDVVGDIAILEIDRPLRKKEKIIANTVLKLNPNIKTVVRKTGPHHGVFRTQKMEVLAGEKKKETIYVENNVKFKVNLEKVYLSPRLSTERKRIMQQVKKNEEILVMFAGAGQYVCTLAKNTNARHVVGIELNQDGHKYSVHNIQWNKLKNAEAVFGDVKKEVPKLKKKFDRILMPLPRGGENFLNVALSAAKKNAVVHFYQFMEQRKFKIAEERVKIACKKAKKKCKILNIVKCGQLKPRVFRVCVDFKIL